MSVVAGYEQSDADARAVGIYGMFDEEVFVGLDTVADFMYVQTGRSEPGVPFVSVLMDAFGLHDMILDRYKDRGQATYGHDVWVNTLRTNTHDVHLVDIDDPTHTFTWAADDSEAS